MNFLLWFPMILFFPLHISTVAMNMCYQRFLYRSDMYHFRLFLSLQLDYVLPGEKAHVPTFNLRSIELGTKWVAAGHLLQGLL